MQDIFELISDLAGLIRKEAIFNGLRNMMQHFKRLKTTIVKISVLGM